jgi:hypothetical protein
MMMSELELLFSAHLDDAGILYTREYQAVPGRKLRWDFFIAPDILVEINGGIWRKCGHSTGKGIQRDYEKINLATLHGFRVFLFSSDDVTSNRAIETIASIIAKNGTQ